jgi:Flp pilus assembly protein TadB
VARESAGDTVGERVARKKRRESASPLKTGEDRRKAQGGERSPSSGFHIAKSGAGVAGPGL